MARPSRLPYAIVDLVGEIKSMRPDAKDPDAEPGITIWLDVVSFNAVRGEADNHSSGRVAHVDVNGNAGFRFAGVLFVCNIAA